MTAVPTRSLRAIDEYMSVIEEGPDLYTVVGQTGGEYVVDLREPACTCPDFEYRDEVRACKHIRRVRLVAGERDAEDVRETLAAAADDAAEEANRLERRAEERRETARRLRRAIDRLDEVADGR